MFTIWQSHFRHSVRGHRAALLLSIRIISERVDDPDLAEGNRCSKCGRFVVSRDEFDVLDVAALRYRLLVKVLFWVCAILTFGIVMVVLMIVRESRFHNRSVLLCTMQYQAMASGL